MDNKQKILRIFDYRMVDERLHMGGDDVWVIHEKEFEDMADKIDALYHRDCGKCIHAFKSGWCERCKHFEKKNDYYEETNK